MRRRDLHRGDGTVGRGRRGGGRRGRAALVAVHAEAVTDAAGAGARRRGQVPQQALALEARHDLAQGLEAVHGCHALHAPAQLALGLGAAQHELGEDRELGRRDVEDLLAVVGVLGHPRAGLVDLAHEPVQPQPREGLADRLLGVARDRVAVRLLVRAVHEGVQGQRVAVGGRERLLDEDADDAGLDVVQGFPMAHDSSSERGPAATSSRASTSRAARVSKLCCPSSALASAGWPK